MFENVKRGEYSIGNQTKKIPLTKGYFAIVDKDLFDELNQYKWYHFKSKFSTTGYAARMVCKKIRFMHREVCPLTYGIFVDHINGNGLDNRRANLRECMPNQNIINRPKQRGKYTSRFKGVSKEKGKDTYRVSISVKGKIQKINGIKDEKTAAKIYDLWAYDVYGERVITNFKRICGSASTDPLTNSRTAE